MDDSPDQHGISFRQYDPQDMRACARLAEEAWPAAPELAPEDGGSWGMEGYIESSLLWSNWRDVACDSNGVIGFLFGRIDKHEGGVTLIKSTLGEFSMTGRFLFGKNDRPPGMLGLFWNLLLTETKLMVKMPRSDAEIELFIVDSQRRGRGIGRMLVDRFVKAAKESGSSLVTVYTDDKTSDWQFYEKYGFRRVGTFYDNLTSYFANVHSNGIIFLLDLETAPEPADLGKSQ
jgi:ribosomal protein S18 acetylase RimI-like enzyme